jgi:hypothetical protein
MSSRIATRIGGAIPFPHCLSIHHARYQDRPIAMPDDARGMPRLWHRSFDRRQMLVIQRKNPQPSASPN